MTCLGAFLFNFFYSDLLILIYRRHIRSLLSTASCFALSFFFCLWAIFYKKISLQFDFQKYFLVNQTMTNTFCNHAKKIIYLPTLLIHGFYRKETFERMPKQLIYCLCLMGFLLLCELVEIIKITFEHLLIVSVIQCLRTSENGSEFPANESFNELLRIIPPESDDDEIENDQLK